MLRFQYSLKFSFSKTLAGVYLQYGLTSSINSAASASFWWITLASPSYLFTYSVGASFSHAAVICWIVSDFFHIFCIAFRCLAASKYISCSFLLVWLGPVLLLESPLFRWKIPHLSAIIIIIIIILWLYRDSQRVGRSGNRILVGRSFPHPSRQDLVPTQPSTQGIPFHCWGKKDGVCHLADTI